jgi:hypothetical protein
MKGGMYMKKAVIISVVLFAFLFTFGSVFAQEQSTCRFTGTLMSKDAVPMAVA